MTKGALAVAILVAASAVTGWATAQVLDVPHPNVGHLDERDRTRIQQLREVVAQAPDDDSLTDPEARQELAAALGELGILYQTHDFVDAAFACYEGALRFDSSASAWRYYIGLLHLTRGDSERAAESFRLYLEQRPGDRATLERLGDVELRRGDLDAAAAVYDQLLAASDATAVAWAGAAEVAQLRGDHALAVERYDKALEIQPEANRLYYPLAQALRRGGDVHRARAMLALAGQKPPLSIDPLASRLAPRSVGFLLEQGGRAGAEGDHERAAQLFSDALELAPDNLAAASSLAAALVAMGERGAGLERLEALAKRAPDLVPLRFQLAATLAAGGGEDEEARAEAELVEILESDPTFVEAHSLLATIALRRGDADRAVERFEQARSLRPNDHQLSWALAEAVAASGDRDLAVRLLTELREIGYERARVSSDLASVLIAADRRDEAKQVLEAELRRSSEQSDRALLALTLGNLQLSEGSLDEAIDTYRAVGSGHGLFDLDFNLATLLLERGETAAAVTSFRSAVEARPSDVEARVALSRSLIESGDASAALEAFEEALESLGQLPELLLGTSRLLAASPVVADRNPPRAVELAEAAVEAAVSVRSVESLAMALAAVGAFDAATRFQARLVDQAERTGSTSLEFLRDNLRRYEGRQPPLFRP